MCCFVLSFFPCVETESLTNPKLVLNLPKVYFFSRCSNAVVGKYRHAYSVADKFDQLSMRGAQLNPYTNSVISFQWIRIRYRCEDRWARLVGAIFWFILPSRWLFKMGNIEEVINRAVIQPRRNWSKNCAVGWWTIKNPCCQSLVAWSCLLYTSPSPRDS